MQPRSIKSSLTTKARCQLSQSQRVEVRRLSKLQDLQMLLKDFFSLLQEHHNRFHVCYFCLNRDIYHT